MSFAQLSTAACKVLQKYSYLNGGCCTLDGSCQSLPESLQICNVLLNLHTLHFALLCQRVSLSTELASVCCMRLSCVCQQCLRAIPPLATIDGPQEHTVVLHTRSPADTDEGYSRNLGATETVPCLLVMEWLCIPHISSGCKHCFLFIGHCTSWQSKASYSPKPPKLSQASYLPGRPPSCGEPIQDGVTRAQSK